LAYASETDVSTRLGRDLTAVEITQVRALLSDASALVDGYLGESVPMDPVPTAVTAVVAKMVARALSPGSVPEGVTTQQQSAGPFQRTVTFAGEGSSLWIGAVEKLMLRPFRSGMVSIGTASDRGAL
jgi:phage gp36-like protein